jgi:bifunctional non-homologous end joining protein LigD
VLLQAFDLLDLDGEDLRARPLEERKAKLAELVRGCDGIRLVEHTEGDGALLFAHA